MTCVAKSLDIKKRTKILRKIKPIAASAIDLTAMFDAVNGYCVLLFLDGVEDAIVSDAYAPCVFLPTEFSGTAWSWVFLEGVHCVAHPRICWVIQGVDVFDGRTF